MTADGDPTTAAGRAVNRLQSSLHLFLVGLLAILSQVVLLRELNVAFYGVELVYILGFAAWMAGSAAGAALGPAGPRLARAGTAPLIAIISLSLPVDVALVRGHRLMLGAVPGAYLSFDRQALLLLAALLPLSFLLGVAFRWAAATAADEGQPLAVAYAVECLGSAAGGAVATLAFASGVQTFSVAVGVAGLLPAILVIARALHHARPGAPIAWRRATLFGAAVAAGTCLALWWAPRLDFQMTAWSHPDVVETRDSPYARITVTASALQVSLFEDDVLTFESETAENEQLAHLAALQHPAPRRILLLGGSVERIDQELQRHSPAALDVVELDRTLATLAARHLGAPPRVVFEDPRAFVRRPGEYDLIVVGMPEPTSGQSNRFYTAEFFRDCASRLSKGGVIGLRMTLSENVITPQIALRTASVVRALRSAFPFTEALPGATAVVIGSLAPLSEDPGVLAERALARHLATRLVTPAYLRYVYENDRRADLLRRLDAVDAPLNSDTRPVCYQYAALIWLTKFFPGLVRVDPARLSDPGHWPLALQLGCVASLLLVVLLVRLRRILRPPALALIAGLAGMLLETVALLDYQAKSGALFEQLGLLVMAFMVGLWAGASAVGRSRWINSARGLRAGGIALAAALAILGGLSAEVVQTGARVGLAGTTLLLGAAGAVVAGLFACASAQFGQGGRAAIGRLYAADLVGGCLGSCLASILLVPLAGLALFTL